MRLLTVPNWSFGRDRDLIQEFGHRLDNLDLAVHYLRGDVDHNRTVSAFSGDAGAVREGLFELSELAFEQVDLTKHTGEHPRIGALDVCPFVPLERIETDADVLELQSWIEYTAAMLADRFDLPVFLYEKSERGRHEAELPKLRRGGFAGLIGRAIAPDFGPRAAHPKLGATVMGWRDFLIAFNVDLEEPIAERARTLAKEARRLRSEGDPRFLGVRALGFSLASREMSQVSFNATLPDLSPVDPVIAWTEDRCAEMGLRVSGTELIGVIRQEDLPGATRLTVAPEQIVDVL